MNLTREQAIAEHRKMWNWIASEIRQRKEVFDIIDLKFSYLIMNRTDFIKNHCFLCEYTVENGEVNCKKCPIEWGSKVKMFMCQNNIDDYDDKGLYGRYCYSTNWQEQAALARKIAELPEREDV